MKFVLKPSLEHMALVKVVISLWNQNDVRALIPKHNCIERCSRERWMTIEKKVMEKVPQLSLPQLLQQNVLALIKPIGLEISMWMKYNYRYLHLNLPVELCWTPQGTVDRKRTAEVLVKDVNLDMSTRYKLACIYCLKDDIHELWNSFNKDLKKLLSNTDFFFINDWSHCMMRRGLGRSHMSIMSNKDKFCYSAQLGNKVAAEYFLQKLTSRERDESLVEAAKYISYTDVLCFLLAEMDEKKQIEVFKTSPYGMLLCFLKWPLQSFFIGVANCMWDFLSTDNFNCLLRFIIIKVAAGDKDWDYQALFKEFWQKSPSALKSFVTDQMGEMDLLSLLFLIKDKENIRLILKDTAITVKEKLVYSGEMCTLCKCFIRDNEWDFLEFCIQECFPSKKQMLKFKETFETRMKYDSCFQKHFATKKRKWNQLFQFSDDSIFNFDKRSVEEGESSSSKRFRRLQ